MVKSSSVGAPEPEKLQKNKVGPIIWDTLYVLLAFGCNNLTIKQCGDKWIAWISNFIVERGLFYKCVQFMFIECWPWLGQTMNIYTLIYQSVANTKLLLQIFSYGQQQTLESSVCVCVVL